MEHCLNTVLEGNSHFPVLRGSRDVTFIIRPCLWWSTLTPVWTFVCSPKFVSMRTVRLASAPTAHAPDNKMDSWFEERLCKEIRRYPHSYNSSFKQYRDSQMVLNSWREIAQMGEMKMPTIYFLHLYFLICIAVSKQRSGALPPPTGMACRSGTVHPWNARPRQTLNCSMSGTVCTSDSLSEP